MDSSVPIQIAETIQTASINRAPSPTHDVNPSTTASSKEPVTVQDSTSSISLDKYTYDDENGIDEDEEEEEDIPYDVLRPTPRRGSFPPLPDLRFEQSYLASISGADTKWKVVFITLRDQLVLPLVQGMVWSLALHGWRYWNRSATMSGTSIGARARRWWHETNNWKIPEAWKDIPKDSKLAADMSDFLQYYKYETSGD